MFFAGVTVLRSLRASSHERPLPALSIHGFNAKRRSDGRREVERRFRFALLSGRRLSESQLFADSLRDAAKARRERIRLSLCKTSRGGEKRPAIKHHGARFVSSLADGFVERLDVEVRKPFVFGLAGLCSRNAHHGHPGLQRFGVDHRELHGGRRGARR